MDLGQDTSAEMYRRMFRSRSFEMAAIEKMKAGQIPGALHTSVGQEASIVGSCMALREDDYMVGNHRSHGHPIGKGAELDRLFAELMGKATGINSGQGRLDAPGRLQRRQPRARRASWARASRSRPAPRWAPRCRATTG